MTETSGHTPEVPQASASAPSTPPNVITTPGEPVFNRTNSRELAEHLGAPTQIRVHVPMPDGSTVEYVYGTVVVNVIEPWSLWLWRMARGAAVALFSRMIWASVGVLIYTHPAGHTAIQSIVAFLM